MFFSVLSDLFSFERFALPAGVINGGPPIRGILGGTKKTDDYRAIYRIYKIPHARYADAIKNSKMKTSEWTSFPGRFGVGINVKRLTFQL